VTDDGDDVGILYSEVTAPVLISKPGTTERSDVRPELVDCTSLDWRYVIGEVTTYTWSIRWKLAGPYQEHLIRAS
jgi:hypothetical protein